MAWLHPLLIKIQNVKVKHYLLGVWASLLFEEAGTAGVMLLPAACFGPVVAVLPAL